jgi:hypothetical protein
VTTTHVVATCPYCGKRIKPGQRACDGDIFLLCKDPNRPESYSVGWDAGRRRWFCSCASRGTCSHLVALLLLVCETATGVDAQDPDDHAAVESTAKPDD